MMDLFRTRRRILIDKSDLLKVMEVFNKYKLTTSDFANMKLGNCGWGLKPDCWFIFINVTDRVWYSVLREFVDRDITLLSETVRYQKDGS